MNELCNNPGLIITPERVIKTTKVKKLVEKLRLKEYEVKYLTPIPADFREVERALKELENTHLGLSPIKEKPILDITDPYEHFYCYFETKPGGGWYDSRYKKELPGYVLLGEVLNGETLNDTHKRLWSDALKIMTSFK